MSSPETQNSLKQILSGLKQGDRKVFEGVFRLHYAELVKYSYQFTQVQTISEEIVQDVFMSLWERRASLKIDSSLKSYLYRAVKNRTINYIRLQLPKDQATTDITETPVMYVEPENDQEESKHLHRLISNAIGELPIKCRTIFLLSRNEGLSHKEIAEELQISVKTVENQVGIALKKLRQSLQPVIKNIH